MDDLAAGWRSRRHDAESGIGGRPRGRRAKGDAAEGTDDASPSRRGEGDRTRLVEASTKLVEARKAHDPAAGGIATNVGVLRGPSGRIRGNPPRFHAGRRFVPSRAT